MIKSIFLFFLNSFRANTQLKLEVIFLTKQLEIYHQTNPKLKINRTDRRFFSLMKNLFSNWKERIFIVKPENVIKWYRSAFKFYWRWKTIAKEGKPRTEREVINFIKQIANENPLWGVPRIHGEMKKLGFEVSESTIQRYIPKRGGRTTGQRWKTFLKNHSKEIISIDFVTVSTINFKLILVLVIIEHHRRKIIHLNVTKNPTAEWILQQLRNLPFEHDTPKYLIRDHDTRFGNLFSAGINQFGIKQIVTAYLSP